MRGSAEACLPAQHLGCLASKPHSVMCSATEHALPPGIFGAILPHVFYVPGASETSAANASLTLSNMTIVSRYCNADLWGPAVNVLYTRNQVRGLPAGLWGAPCPAACTSITSCTAQHAACCFVGPMPHQPHGALSSILGQAGMRIGFGNEQRLTCVSCTFVGTDRNGGSSSGAQAVVQLFNTSILCQSLTTSADVYTNAAMSAPASTCSASVTPVYP